MSRLIREIAIAGALLLAVASCGTGTAETTTPTLPTLDEQPTGQDADTATTTTTTEAVSGLDALLEYAECLRENGVEIADLEGTEDGQGLLGAGAFNLEDFDFEAYEAAVAECGTVQDAFGEFTLNSEQEAEIMDAQLAFSQCMRANGIDGFPDPPLDSGIELEVGDTDQETLEAAIRTCSGELELGGITLGGTS